MRWIFSITNILISYFYKIKEKYLLENIPEGQKNYKSFIRKGWSIVECHLQAWHESLLL